MADARLSTKGQLVIPKAVREYLGVKQGDQLDFIIRDDGEVTIRPATGDVRELKGILPRPAEAVSLDTIKEAIRKRAGRKSD